MELWLVKIGPLWKFPEEGIMEFRVTNIIEEFVKLVLLTDLTNMLIGFQKRLISLWASVKKMYIL